MIGRFLRKISSEILFAELFIGSLVVLGLALGVLVARVEWGGLWD